MGTELVGRTALSLAVIMIAIMDMDVSDRRPACMRQRVHGRRMSRHPERERNEQQGGKQERQTSHASYVGVPMRERQAGSRRSLCPSGQAQLQDVRGRLKGEIAPQSTTTAVPSRWRSARATNPARATPAAPSTIQLL